MADIKRKVPNLRFKGFTDDWEQHKLGEIITYYNGKSHEEQFRNAETQNFELVTLKSIDENGNLCSSEKYIDSTNNTLSKNDLIMVLSEQNKGLVGMTTLIPRDNYYVLNQRVALLKLHKNNSPFFLTDAINQHQIFFERMSAGTKVQNISKSNVENFNLYIPNYSEQKEVGHIIALCQNIITLQQRKLALLKQLKKGLLQKMFAEKNSKQPVLRFKGFHDDWEQRKLGEVAEIKTGSRNHQDSVDNGKYPFFVRSEKVERLNEYDFDTKAILVPGDGRIGEIFHYYDGKFALHQRVYKVDNFKEVNPLYLLNLFKYKFKKHALRLNSQGTVPSLRLPMFTNWNILIPNLNEQQKIGLFFQQFDSLIALNQRKQNHLKLLKKSLLQQMFI